LDALDSGLAYDPDAGIDDWCSLPKLQWFDRHNPSIHQDHEHDVYYRVVLFNDWKQFNSVRRTIQVSVDMTEGQERMMFLRAPVNVLFVGYRVDNEEGAALPDHIRWHSAYIVRATDELDAYDFVVNTYGVRGLSPMIKPLLGALLDKSPLCKFKGQKKAEDVQNTSQSIHCSGNTHQPGGNGSVPFGSR
jgi:hypothetical protein